MNNQANIHLPNKTTNGLSKIPIFRHKYSSSTLEHKDQKENHVPGNVAFVNKFRKECNVSEKPSTTKPTTIKPVIENIDKDYNCYLLSDYAADIYKYLREVEVELLITTLVLSFIVTNIFNFYRKSNSLNPTFLQPTLFNQTCVQFSSTGSFKCIKLSA